MTEGTVAVKLCGGVSESGGEEQGIAWEEMGRLGIFLGKGRTYP